MEACPRSTRLGTLWNSRNRPKAVCRGWPLCTDDGRPKEGAMEEAIHILIVIIGAAAAGSLLGLVLVFWQENREKE